MLQNHELRLLHIGVALTAVLVTEGLRFSIWVPLVVCLDMSVILVERVVQVTVHPRQLRNVTEEEWSLLVSLDLRVISLSERVQLLVEIGVDNIISKVPMGLSLMPEVLWHGRMITKHFLFIY